MEKKKKSQEGKQMKEVIEKALTEMCSNSRFAINSESGRSDIAEHLLKILLGFRAELPYFLFL